MRRTQGARADQPPVTHQTDSGRKGRCSILKQAQMPLHGGERDEHVRLMLQARITSCPASVNFWERFSMWLHPDPTSTPSLIAPP
jgi:hypothetical protein